MKIKINLNFWRKFLGAFLVISLVGAGFGIPFYAINEMSRYSAYSNQS